MSEKVEEKGRKGTIALERIENVILLIRDERVILDNDLARLYGVETRRLNEQVRRNSDRFPHDFMFQVSPEEFEHLKSHFATSRSGWGGRRKLPLAFTEHGAIIAVIKQLMAPPPPEKKRPIGFRPDEK